tara:strand:+ start:235 stop:939 length:705 start_codon:yes stop_codon:yes gene_type:complete
MKILVFTATYNESENIEKLINKIFSLKINLNLLIVDDNSPDKTYEKILLLKKKYRKIKLILRKKKEGIDTAHKLAFNFAKKNKYDYLITMDADLSHNPQEIPKFIANIKKCHFVIGARYMKGGLCKMKPSRLLLSKYGNLLIKYFFDIHLDEFTTSYRAFNMKKLKNFNLKKVTAKGYSFFMETVYLLSKKNFILKQIPITFYDRKKGSSKIPKLEIFRTLYNIFLIKFKIKKI